MLIEYDNVSIYQKEHLVIQNIHFHADCGEFIYLTGKVGSGKSSILRTIYADLPIEDGSANILGVDLKRLKRKDIPSLRKQMGIIFQEFQLLTDRTVEKNLAFVLKATGWKKKDLMLQRISEVLDIVGMSDATDKYPHELSGGERQRISIARAILNNPRIIIADEPTGHLDKENSTAIVRLLHDICEKGATVVMSTHNTEFLQQFPGIVYHIKDGVLSEETLNREISEQAL